MKAIYIIRVAELSLNKDGVRYLFPAVWTNLLRARVWAPSGLTIAVNVKVPHLGPICHHGTNLT